MPENLVVVPYIRRIADDDGKIPGERAEPVAQYKRDPARDMEVGIGPGNGERFFADVGGNDAAGRAFPGKCQGDGATAGPQVGEGEWQSGRDMLKRRLHQALGLGARDQRVGIDL